jgi:hypothetical protein
MTGLKVVFDRERFVLGWSKFDCEYTQVTYTHAEETFIVTSWVFTAILRIVGYRDVEMEDVGSADPAPATASGPAMA